MLAGIRPEIQILGMLVPKVFLLLQRLQTSKALGKLDRFTGAVPLDFEWATVKTEPR